MGEERLNALATISIENETISNEVDFYKKLTDMFR